MCINGRKPDFPHSAHAPSDMVPKQGTEILRVHAAELLCGTLQVAKGAEFIIRSYQNQFVEFLEDKVRGTLS